MPTESIADRIARIRAQRAAGGQLRNAVQDAMRLRDAADEWPRCGQQWPGSARECAAQALIENNPAIAAELEKFA